MSSGTICDNVKPPVALSSFTAASSALLSVITIGGNFLICLAVYKDPYKLLRTPFMHFLVSLSISDLVAGCITMPVSMVIHIREAREAVLETRVEIVRLSYLISATASLLNLIALCFDRYIAVTKPMKYRHWMTFPRCFVVSIIIWILSISISLCLYLTNYVTFLMIYTNTAILLILLAVLFTYFRISRALKIQSFRMKSHQNSSSNKYDPVGVQKRNTQKIVERKVTRMYVTIISLFLATNVPVIIIVFILWFCSDCNCILRHVLRDVQFTFSLSNSAINPFVCTIRLKPFHESIKSILGKPARATEVTMSDSKSSPIPVEQDNRHDIQ